MKGKTTQLLDFREHLQIIVQNARTSNLPLSKRAWITAAFPPRPVRLEVITTRSTGNPQCSTLFKRKFRFRSDLSIWLRIIKRSWLWRFSLTTLSNSMTWRGNAPVCWSALAASLRLSLQVSVTWCQSIAIKRPSWPNVPTVSKNRCRRSPRSLKENASTPLENCWLIGTKDLTDTADDEDGLSRSITGARFGGVFGAVDAGSTTGAAAFETATFWTATFGTGTFGTAGLIMTFGAAAFGTAGLTTTLGAADGFGTLLVALDEDDGRIPRELWTAGGG